MHIGAQVVNPNLFGLRILARRTLIEKDDVRLDAGLIENAGRQPENGM